MCANKNVPNHSRTAHLLNVAKSAPSPMTKDYWRSSRAHSEASLASQVRLSAGGNRIRTLGPWWKRTGRLLLDLGVLGCCRSITSACAPLDPPPRATLTVCRRRHEAADPSGTMAPSAEHSGI